MYGLTQARLLAQQFPKQILENKGYVLIRFAPGFWKQRWRPIAFTLVVNDSGLKYVGKKQTKHLIKSPEDHFKILEEF